MRVKPWWIVAWGCLAFGPTLHAQDEPTVIYLVRHAETVADGTRDPALSERGRERAAILAALLRDAGITDLHSTDLRRTRQTAEPVSRSEDLEIVFYDPSQLETFAIELQNHPGRHLIVGHSNTTPALVRALGGDPGSPIPETEYNRLYIVTLFSDGSPSTTLLRYGVPPEG